MTAEIEFFQAKKWLQPVIFLRFLKKEQKEEQTEEQKEGKSEGNKIGDGKKTPREKEEAMKNKTERPPILKTLRSFLVYV